MKEKMQVRVDAEIKKILREIAEESKGKLTMSELVRLFIYEGLDNRGLLPGSEKAKLKEPLLS
jgi:antitoxin component of RelBE/YafQ-DinJ toxin-antitoxin module